MTKSYKFQQEDVTVNVDLANDFTERQDGFISLPVLTCNGDQDKLNKITCYQI